jgi:hypothetical protein
MKALCIQGLSDFELLSIRGFVMGYWGNSHIV